MLTRRKFIKVLTALYIAVKSGKMPTLEPDHIAAHDHCHLHRQEILSSNVCGCFFCLSIYTPDKIWDDEWIYEDESGVGQTARCPVCGIDSVIGAKSGYPIKRDFLAKMERHWFNCGQYPAENYKRYTKDGDTFKERLPIDIYDGD